MRVTQQMLSANTMRHINQGYSQLGKLQDQLTTGKRITRVSQDPVIAMKGLQHRQASAEISQFKRNISEAQNWLDHSEGVLDQGAQILKRISDLTIQASNDTYDEGQRDNIAKEIGQLKQYMQDLGNSKVDNRYLFNGANTDTAPIQKDAVIAMGIGPLLEGANAEEYTVVYNNQSFRFVEGEDGTYVFQDIRQIGQELDEDDRVLLTINFEDEENPSITFSSPANGGTIEEVEVNQLATIENRAISMNTQDVTIEVNKGIHIPVNVQGSDLFSAELFGEITRLEAILKDPNTTGEDLTSFITSIDQHHSNFVSERSEVGVRLNRIEMMTNRLEDQDANLKKMMTNNEDVDIEETIMNLIMAENVHRIAMSSGARIIQPSLMDFLR
ncbi:flagellar hook-associated protein FlgL [Alkalicoccobacillus gibsonii]|uniref:flagellar hook-associated protein FlgL n=1 Tax=Alkalicoccobacillus gibsonii TaxID=79881 RepID=UPI001931C47B|nr:flagellar hook-associated protein FlgL [Alkalicoccobacillus gibsonii]MBM0066108.1 flagellar hook-associated protein FlgL [Alkalicoccobacillus gibsonii]